MNNEAGSRPEPGTAAWRRWQLTEIAPDHAPPGIDHSRLFRGILRVVRDEKQVTIPAARESTKATHAHHYSRMRYLFAGAGEDPVDACLRAAIELLVERDILKPVENVTDIWTAGKKFRSKGRMNILRDQDDRHWIWTDLDTQETPADSEKLDTLLQREEAAHKGQTEAAKLRPGGPGLRPIDAANLKAIKDRVRAQGILPQDIFKVVIDQEGRILSGRHRLKAAEELSAELGYKIEWPLLRVTVENDEEALAIAIEANRGLPWRKEKAEALDKLQIGPKLRRAMIREALLRDANRSNVAIAAVVGGVSRTTVEDVRRELEATCQIGRFVRKGGSGVTTGTPVPGPKPLTEQHKQILAIILNRGRCTDAQIFTAMRALRGEPGLSDNTLRPRRHELHQEGWITGQKERLPGDVRKLLRWEIVPARYDEVDALVSGITVPAPVTGGGPARSTPLGAADALPSTPDVGPVVQAPVQASTTNGRKTGASKGAHTAPEVTSEQTTSAAGNERGPSGDQEREGEETVAQEALKRASCQASQEAIEKGVGYLVMMAEHPEDYRAWVDRDRMYEVYTTLWGTSDVKNQIAALCGIVIPTDAAGRSS